MSDNKKSYYAIIPADVRYDKDLIPNAKLLYGEITALCNDKGYCWASNEYFAELYGVSKKTISSWISQLASKRYIKTELEYKGGSKEIVNRYIRISGYPMEENVNTPIHEKVTDNNTNINTTTNITFNKGANPKFTPPTFEEVKSYCQERNKNVDAEKWYDFYLSKGWMIGKNKMKDWQAAVRTWEKDGTPKQQDKPKYQQQEGKRQYDAAELEKMLLGR